METVIDPISGKRVRIQDMPEHMRIQLLDPKWAEERKKFQDKQKDSNLVQGDVMADNLARLAQARGMAVRTTQELGQKYNPNTHIFVFLFLLFYFMNL